MLSLIDFNIWGNHNKKFIKFDLMIKTYVMIPWQKKKMQEIRIKFQRYVVYERRSFFVYFSQFRLREFFF